MLLFRNNSAQYWLCLAVGPLYLAEMAKLLVFTGQPSETLVHSTQPFILKFFWNLKTQTLYFGWLHIWIWIPTIIKNIQFFAFWCVWDNQMKQIVKGVWAFS